MLKVEEVAQSALSAVNSTAGRVLATTWVNDRYRELIGKVRFKHTRKIGELSIPAAVTTGAVTATLGSTSIIPDATALAAWAGGSFAGWHFRAGIVWYRVGGSTGGQLQLASPYAETTVTAGGYALVKREFDLPTNVRSLDLFMHMRRRTSFTCVPLELLDALAPSRHDISSGPGYATELGQGDNGGKRIEVYPPSSTTELLHYVYRELPERLQLTDTLPSVIDGYVLKEGVLIDVMRWEMAQALKGPKMSVEAAAVWRNESRAQETVWMRKVQAAIMADRGVDDQTFVLIGTNTLGRNSGSLSNIVTAQDQVWNRG